MQFASAANAALAMRREREAAERRQGQYAAKARAEKKQATQTAREAKARAERQAAQAVREAKARAEGKVPRTYKAAGYVDRVDFYGDKNLDRLLLPPKYFERMFDLYVVQAAGENPIYGVPQKQSGLLQFIQATHEAELIQLLLAARKLSQRREAKMVDARDIKLAEFITGRITRAQWETKDYSGDRIKPKYRKQTALGLDPKSQDPKNMGPDAPDDDPDDEDYVPSDDDRDEDYIPAAPAPEGKRKRSSPLPRLADDAEIRQLLRQQFLQYMVADAKNQIRDSESKGLYTHRILGHRLRDKYPGYMAIFATKESKDNTVWRAYRKLVDEEFELAASAARWTARWVRTQPEEEDDNSLVSAFEKDLPAAYAAYRDNVSRWVKYYRNADEDADAEAASDVKDASRLADDVEIRRLLRQQFADKMFIDEKDIVVDLDTFTEYKAGTARNRLAAVYPGFQAILATRGSADKAAWRAYRKLEDEETLLGEKMNRWAIKWAQSKTKEEDKNIMPTFAKDLPDAYAAYGDNVVTRVYYYRNRAEAEPDVEDAAGVDPEADIDRQESFRKTIRKIFVDHAKFEGGMFIDIRTRQLIFTTEFQQQLLNRSGLDRITSLRIMSEETQKGIQIHKWAMVNASLDVTTPEKRKTMFDKAIQQMPRLVPAQFTQADLVNLVSRYGGYVPIKDLEAALRSEFSSKAVLLNGRLVRTFNNAPVDAKDVMYSLYPRLKVDMTDKVNQEIKQAEALHRWAQQNPTADPKVALNSGYMIPQIQKIQSMYKTNEVKEDFLRDLRATVRNILVTDYTLSDDGKTLVGGPNKVDVRNRLEEIKKEVFNTFAGGANRNLLETPAGQRAFTDIMTTEIDLALAAHKWFKANPSDSVPVPQKLSQIYPAGLRQMLIIKYGAINYAGWDDMLAKPVPVKQEVKHTLDGYTKDVLQPPPSDYLDALKAIPSALEQNGVRIVRLTNAIQFENLAKACALSRGRSNELISERRWNQLVSGGPKGNWVSPSGPGTVLIDGNSSDLYYNSLSDSYRLPEEKLESFKTDKVDQYGRARKWLEGWALVGNQNELIGYCIVSRSAPGSQVKILEEKLAKVTPIGRVGNVDLHGSGSRCIEVLALCSQRPNKKSGFGGLLLLWSIGMARKYLMADYDMDRSVPSKITVPSRSADATHISLILASAPQSEISNYARQTGGMVSIVPGSAIHGGGDSDLANYKLVKVYDRFGFAPVFDRSRIIINKKSYAVNTTKTEIAAALQRWQNAGQVQPAEIKYRAANPGETEWYWNSNTQLVMLREYPTVAELAAMVNKQIEVLNPPP